MADAEDVMECFGCGILCFITLPDSDHVGYCSARCKARYKKAHSQIIPCSRCGSTEKLVSLSKDSYDPGCGQCGAT